MKPPPPGANSFVRPRRDVLLAGIAVPVAALVLLALGAGLVAATRQRGYLTAELTVALTAAVGGVLLTAWWAGGLVMLALTALARRLSWTRLERITTRLTPALLTRAVGALLGLQLVAVAPAQAGEAVNPFWTSADGAPGQAPQATPDADPPNLDGPGAPAGGRAPQDGVLADPGTGISAGASGGTGDPAAPTSPAGPIAAAGEAPVPTPAGQRVVDGMLTVVSGDTLWDLTAQLLVPGADAGRIATATATWAEHNDLPGGPDLIRPGERLRVPPQLLESHRSQSSGAPS